MYSGQDLLAEGFPHSDICGSTIARISPQLFAACHVLHRLLAPRHPPNALISLHPTTQHPHAGPSTLTPGVSRHHVESSRPTTDAAAGTIQCLKLLTHQSRFTCQNSTPASDSTHHRHRQTGKLCFLRRSTGKLSPQPATMCGNPACGNPADSPQTLWRLSDSNR